MRAMQLAAAGKPLRLVDREIGKPDAGQLLLRVLACGVCRTDLHIADGELPRLARPAIPGHEVVGEVIERGARSERFSIGQRVGVPWLGWTCGDCDYCRSGRKTCATARASPATTSTEATPSLRLPTAATALLCPRVTRP